MQDTADLLQIKIEKAKRELPLETINAINSVDWRAAILTLRGKKGFTFEQLGDLELETELLLAGLVSPNDYPKELEKSMGISRSVADELVNEMNDLVFKKIREELVKNSERKRIFQREEWKNEVEKTNEKVFDSTSIELVPEKLELTAPENTEEHRKDMLKQIEKPENIPMPPVRPTTTPTPTPVIQTKTPSKTDIEAESEKIHPILAQKMTGSMQIPATKTEYSLSNISKTSSRDSAVEKGVGESSTISLKPKIQNIDPYREIPE